MTMDMFEILNINIYPKVMKQILKLVDKVYFGSKKSEKSSCITINEKKLLVRRF